MRRKYFNISVLSAQLTQSFGITRNYDFQIEISNFGIT